MTERPGRDQNLRTDAASQATAPRPRSFAALLVFLLCAALACSGLVALGTWQVKRLHWKRALIERVEQRVHAEPVATPAPERWPHITAESDEYRHVRLTGTYLHASSTKVQAATALGSGYWLLTPLRDAEGNIFLINRGFIPPDAAPDTLRREAGEVTVTGLLRIPEPGGGFLRDNDPAADRWYSRDVQGIAAARGLTRVAPYFIDADANPPDTTPKYPVGGLTVISFHNNHLSYALTWYALALMVAGATIWVLRQRSDRHS